MESKSMEIIEVNSHKEIPNKFTGIAKYPSGTQEWYLNGKLHLEDGPALIHSDGRQEWYLNGKLHRDDGPAIIWPDGEQGWFLNGIKMTPMELFEKLSVEQKEKALWNLNQWK